VNLLTSPGTLKAEVQKSRTEAWRGLNFEKQVDALFHQFQDKIHKRTDRLFAALLAAEWMCAIIAAWLISPRAWAGMASTTHPHVWMAIALGGVVVALPIFLALKYPGQTLTRHFIAIGQMLISTLLIHVTGGRIETHFHIFGSLAFLAFYYDWRVLITASTVVTLDHVVRGYYWPQSVYGTAAIEPWRWVEHAGWVVFQDVFLVYACVVSTRDLKFSARKEIEIETSHEMVEEQVKARTSELKESENRLAAQFAVTQCLNRGGSLEETANAVLESIGEQLVTGTKFAAFLVVNKDTQQMDCTATWSNPDYVDPSNKTGLNRLRRTGTDLPALKFADGRIKMISRLDKHGDARSVIAQECGLTSQVAFPLTADETATGAIELYFADRSLVDDETMIVLASLGRQIGQYVIRRQAEDENRRLASVVRSSADAIIGVAEDQTINSWNEGAKRLYGSSLGDVKGKDISLIVNGDASDEMAELLRRAREEGLIEGHETVHQRKDGSAIDVSLSISPIYDQAGNIFGESVIARDISDKKAAETRVSEFYSTVSHELRTPLTSIRAALGLMEGGKAGELTAKSKQLVHIARTESERLIRLINDILDLRKLEAGKLELKLQVWRPDELVRAAVRGIKAMADSAGVSIEISGDFEPKVSCDRDRFIQVLANLISNAIKFSTSGSKVEVRGEPRGEVLRIAVVDHGPGISADQMSKLFGKFQQLDSSDSRSKGGTGLGLAISKEIVEQHGGAIGLDSEFGKGSTFWFELPLLPETKEDSSAQSMLCNDVLLVEDDEQLRNVLTHVLVPEGYRILPARTIAEAEKILKECSPKVILLDVQLPDGNGLEFADKLRNREDTKDLPIIVITGRDQDGDSFNKPMLIDWLRKPFDITRLEMALTIAVRAGKLKTMTVLVVEDDLPTRETIVEHVKSLGLRCLEAADGSSAIDSVHKEHLDLIILDLGIPNMDGFEVVASLRKENIKEIPLLVYTNRDLSKEERDRLTLGLTLHLSKSHTSEAEFRAAVRELLLGIVPVVDSGGYPTLELRSVG
jgi:PAS domain S-box-containing protein